MCLGKTPSPATLSRFINKISSTMALEKDFYALVKHATELGMIDGSKAALTLQKVAPMKRQSPNQSLRKMANFLNIAVLMF